MGTNVRIKLQKQKREKLPRERHQKGVYKKTSGRKNTRRKKGQRCKTISWDLAKRRKEKEKGRNNCRSGCTGQLYLKKGAAKGKKNVLTAGVI